MDSLLRCSYLARNSASGLPNRPLIRSPRAPTLAGRPCTHKSRLVRAARRMPASPRLRYQLCGDATRRDVPNRRPCACCVQGSRLSALLVREDTQQRVVVLADGRVALARTLSHSFDVGDADTPSPVFNESSFLKRVSDYGNTGAPDTQHLGQELLRERENIGLGKVARPEKPSSKPRFNFVRDVAGRRLLCLGIHRLFVTDQQRVQRRALDCGS